MPFDDFTLATEDDPFNRLVVNSATQYTVSTHKAINNQPLKLGYNTGGPGPTDNFRRQLKVKSTLVQNSGIWIPLVIASLDGGPWWVGNSLGGHSIFIFFFRGADGIQSMFIRAYDQGNLTQDFALIGHVGTERYLDFIIDRDAGVNGRCIMFIYSDPGFSVLLDTLIFDLWSAGENLPWYRVYSDFGLNANPSLSSGVNREYEILQWPEITGNIPPHVFQGAIGL
jgi:hypothetical protein